VACLAQHCAEKALAHATAPSWLFSLVLGPSGRVPRQQTAANAVKWRSAWGFAYAGLHADLSAFVHIESSILDGFLGIFPTWILNSLLLI
jgi:hypothetical protein